MSDDTPPAEKPPQPEPKRVTYATLPGLVRASLLAENPAEVPHFSKLDARTQQAVIYLAMAHMRNGEIVYVPDKGSSEVRHTLTIDDDPGELAGYVERVIASDPAKVREATLLYGRLGPDGKPAWNR